MSVSSSTARWRVQGRTFEGPPPDPLNVWNLLGNSPWRFWLDSGPLLNSGEMTLLAGGLPVWVFSGRNHKGELWSPGRPTLRFSFQNPADVLRELILAGSVSGDSALPFSGGAVGFWGYECGRYFDPGIHPAIRSGNAWSDVPDFVWVLPSVWVISHRGGMNAVYRQSQDKESATNQSLKKWIGQIQILDPEAITKAGPTQELSPEIEDFLQTNRDEYIRQVLRVKRLIENGDIYQANLTHRMSFPWPGRPAVSLFRTLRILNPSPYATLMEFPSFRLISCSPERLLRVRGSRVETRPIAGTRRRGENVHDDARLSGELLLSPKERAEHIMLVDLERNDLGRVCRPGTVRVPERMTLEKYSHVIHIVSQVEGELQNGLDGFDASAALFPGGTITGCPKLRCMEILAQLEKERRGPFFGSAGWIGPDGNMDLNILIRTALIEKGKMSLRVGAGLVADSQPEAEYEETLHKARALAAAYETVLHGKSLSSPASAILETAGAMA